MCFRFAAAAVFALLSVHLIFPVQSQKGIPIISSKNLSAKQMKVIRQIVNNHTFTKDWVNGQIQYYVGTQGPYMKSLYANYTAARALLLAKVKTSREKKLATYSVQQRNLALQLQGLEDNQMLRIVASCIEMNKLIANAMNATKNSTAEQKAVPGSLASLKLPWYNCTKTEMTRVFPMYFPPPNGRLTGYNRFPWNILP